jgi:hypothetical protein
MINMAKELKPFIVTIELDIFEFEVMAKNKSEAKKKALGRLNRKKPSSLISRSYPDNKLNCYVDEF